MPKFIITALNPLTQDEKKILYNTDDNSLVWEDGTSIIPKDDLVPNSYSGPQVKLHSGKRNLKKVKIQLGLSCNYECEYCSQRFVPHADSTNPSDVKPFVDNMHTWFEGGDDGLGAGCRFEFWGGEPFVYWKTLKPLAETIKQKYPNADFGIVTNGSMFDDEKVSWLEQLNFTVGISHDGPGQPVRGPDPLEDIEKNQAIVALFKKFAPVNKVSFNPMVNSKNISRESIQLFFEEWVRKNVGEDYLQYLTLGEGGFVDAYDEGGIANSLLEEENELKYRNIALNEFRDNKATRYATVNFKIRTFIDSIIKQTKISQLGQKCGMDREDNIAVDLNGNVITCQNVSAVSKNPSGVSHHIGNISDLQKIELNSAKHWSDREECPKCPVVHICKGSCMFLSGELWEASCNNSFSDSIVIFTLAIEGLTGHIPMYIEGDHRQDRKDIFWWVNGKPENTRKAKKIIPIVAV